jgi:pimeloyl-ACP methyl ester carboxylesterase
MIGQTNPQTVSRELNDRLGALAAEVRTRLYDTLLSVAPPHATPLRRAISAEQKTMHTHRGPVLSYYEDRRHHGEARPLVLIHGLNACASAYEVRPLFDRYRATRPVYAIDLPGFGLSERGALAYTPETYAAELIEFLTRVKDRDGEAPDVVALTLSCEILARAALARKDLVHALTFISPTGFDADRPREAGPGARAVAEWHWWSPLVYRAIVSRPSIRYFLGKSFVGPVDDGLRDYAYETSHQPGAEYAPLAFLSGKLSTSNVYDTYAALERPVLVLYDADGYVGFDRLGDLVEESLLWSSERISPTRGLPQFERLDETAAALDAFWRSHAYGASR